MNVLVDTSVWSLALRRPLDGGEAYARELDNLIDAEQALIIGPVRQEVLSGIRSAAQFESIRDALRAFPDIALVARDYERAATYFNRCRARGFQSSHTDFLICAVASRRDLSIFTADRDFQLFQKVLSVRLHRAAGI